MREMLSFLCLLVALSVPTRVLFFGDSMNANLTISFLIFAAAAAILWCLPDRNSYK